MSSLMVLRCLMIPFNLTNNQVSGMDSNSEDNGDVGVEISKPTVTLSVSMGPGPIVSLVDMANNVYIVIHVPYHHGESCPPCHHCWA